MSGAQARPAPAPAPIGPARLPQPARRALRRTLVEAASARYRPVGRFAWHFARGKLGADPLFTDLLALGVLPPEARWLDLGCGQAVLAAWLLAAQAQAEAGRWPAPWPRPPRLLGLRGIELMPRDVARARAAFAAEPRVQVAQGDICRTPFPAADVVSLFDVLHYFGPGAQHDVLRRVRQALRPGGLLVARVGDAEAGWRFALSHRVDQAVTLVRGHGFSPLHCRAVSDWAETLGGLGFQVQAVRSHGGPPFANTMLIARVPVAAA